MEKLTTCVQRGFLRRGGSGSCGTPYRRGHREHGPVEPRHGRSPAAQPLAALAGAQLQRRRGGYCSRRYQRELMARHVAPRDHRRRRYDAGTLHGVTLRHALALADLARPHTSAHPPRTLASRRSREHSPPCSSSQPEHFGPPAAARHARAMTARRAAKAAALGGRLTTARWGVLCGAVRSVSAGSALVCCLSLGSSPSGDESPIASDLGGATSSRSSPRQLPRGNATCDANLILTPA